jgi:hypothetical protein
VKSRWATAEPKWPIPSAPPKAESIDGANQVRLPGGQFEQENARPKKLLAERDLEIEVMKEIAAKKW